MDNEISVALMAGFAAALITSLFSMLANNKTIISENVIHERAKWREGIRILSQTISENIANKNLDKIMQLRNELAVKLNPFDIDDNEILELLDKFKNSIQSIESISNVEREFIIRISLLLKHDWERAKLENTILKKYFFEANREKYSNLSLKNMNRLTIRKTLLYVIIGISFLFIYFNIIDNIIKIISRGLFINYEKTKDIICIVSVFVFILGTIYICTHYKIDIFRKKKKCKIDEKKV